MVLSTTVIIVYLITVLITAGLLYGYIHNIIHDWTFLVAIIITFIITGFFKYIGIPNIYVVIIFLLLLACSLFFLNKLAAIIMCSILGILMLHLLYKVVVKGVNVTQEVNNFFNDMSVSSMSGIWESIKKIANFICGYNIKGFLTQIVKNSMLIIFFMYLALVVYIYKKQPFQIVSDNKSIFLFIFLFIGFALLSLLAMGFEAFVPFITSFLKYTVLIGIVLGIILAILHVYNNVPMIANTVLFVINIAILIGIFTMIVKFIGAEAPGYISGPPTWSSLLFKMLIYLPCLCLNFVDSIKTELKLAQTTGWTYVIILIIEIILIALLFILPKAFDAVINHNGEVIVDSVLPLNVSNTLQASSSDSNNNSTSALTPSLVDSVINNEPIYNYGLSAWFYIHPQPLNTNSSYTKSTVGVSILNFSGSPTISYNPVDASGNAINAIVVSVTGSTPITTIPSIPLQRWNHLFINFNNGIMDVFLNNKLEKTTSNIFPNVMTNLTVGKDKGIYGQACNVMYFRNPLGSDAISWIYNTHKNLNPPLSPNF
jgi:hypothetical protein